MFVRVIFAVKRRDKLHPRATLRRSRAAPRPEYLRHAQPAQSGNQFATKKYRERHVPIETTCPAACKTFFHVPRRTAARLNHARAARHYELHRISADFVRQQAFIAVPQQN